MCVSAVRMGRIPKVEKEKALEVFHQEGADFNKLELKLEQTGAGNYDFQLNPKPDKKASPREGLNVCTSNQAQNYQDNAMSYYDMKRKADTFRDDRMNKGHMFGNENGNQSSGFHHKGSANLPGNGSAYYCTSNENDISLSHKPESHLHYSGHFNDIENIPERKRYPDNFSHHNIRRMYGGRLVDGAEANKSGYHGDYSFEASGFDTRPHFQPEGMSERDSHLIDSAQFARSPNTGGGNATSKHNPTTMPSPAWRSSDEPYMNDASLVHPKFSMYKKSTSDCSVKSENTVSSEAVDLTKQLHNFVPIHGNGNEFSFAEDHNTVKESEFSVPQSTNNGGGFSQVPQPRNARSLSFPAEKWRGFTTPAGVQVPHLQTFASPASKTEWQSHSAGIYSQISPRAQHHNHMLKSPLKDSASPFYWPSETMSSVDGRSSPAPSNNSRDSKGSNNSGSSKSNPYTPVLIKLLIEQVLESTTGAGVLDKLREKLKHANLDPQISGKIIGLFREVMTHSPKHQERNFSSPETCLTSLSDLTESKKERIAHFLNDVDENFPLEIEKYHESFNKKRKLSETEIMHSIGRLGMREADVPNKMSFIPQPDSSISSSGNRDSGWRDAGLPIAMGLPGGLDYERMKTLEDGLNLGLKIIFRLKPEHRDKLSRHKAGTVGSS